MKNYGLKYELIIPEKDYIFGGFGSMGGEMV